MKSPPPLILASTSRYRRELLARLGIPFETAAPHVDETAQHAERPRELAVRLAREKAGAVAVRHPTAWVIGSDQVAEIDTEPHGGLALGKPGSVESCRAQLLACSGRTVHFVTAVAVVRHADSALQEFVDVTRVVFRSLDEESVARYVEREQPLDCAGGFKSESLGITLVESITSTDPTGLIGLPLVRLSGVLRAVGYRAP